MQRSLESKRRKREREPSLLTLKIAREKDMRRNLQQGKRFSSVSLFNRASYFSSPEEPRKMMPTWNVLMELESLPLTQSSWAILSSIC